MGVAGMKFSKHMWNDTTREGWVLKGDASRKQIPYARHDAYCHP